MAKRVGVVLTGCGHRDGTDTLETVVALVAMDRAGAQVICAAPDVSQREVIDHATGAVAKGTRRVVAESSRLTRGRVAPLAQLQATDIDALLFPGGEGVTSILSNYRDKAELCEVDPDVIRLVRAMLSSRKPIGFIGLSALIGARVLGPLAGVRLTLGPKALPVNKHAAVMGADVRPCAVRDVIIDQKTRVVSTPAGLYEEARPAEIATAVEKLVRSVLGMAKDRAPAPAPLKELPVETSGPTRGSA